MDTSQPTEKEPAVDSTKKVCKSKHRSMSSEELNEALLERLERTMDSSADVKAIIPFLLIDDNIACIYNKETPVVMAPCYFKKYNVEKGYIAVNAFSSAQLIQYGAARKLRNLKWYLTKIQRLFMSKDTGSRVGTESGATRTTSSEPMPILPVPATSSTSSSSTTTTNTATTVPPIVEESATPTLLTPLPKVSAPKRSVSEAQLPRRYPGTASAPSRGATVRRLPIPRPLVQRGMPRSVPKRAPGTPANAGLTKHY